MSERPRAIVLMGVSGCGKTSVGVRLSEILGWPYFDADEYHPAENVAKMAAGIPLSDEDRIPWLDALHDVIHEHLGNGRSILLSCSALKESYRQRLTADNPGTVFVYLKGDFELIFRRMQARKGHYMKAQMLQSQFDALEEPGDAIVVGIDQNIEAIVNAVIEALRELP